MHRHNIAIAAACWCLAASARLLRSSSSQPAMAHFHCPQVKSSASLWATAQSCLGMLQALYCDRSFVLLSFAFGLGLGVFNGLFTVLGSVLGE